MDNSIEEEQIISEIPNKDDAFEENLNHSTLYYNNMKIAKSYNIPTFDPVKELNDKRNFSMIICSKRRTGKSIFMLDLCHKIKNWYITGYVFSMTADLQKDMYDFVNKKNVFNSFNEEKLQEIWDKQEKMVMAMRTAKVKEEEIPHVLIVLDDVVSDPRVRKSEILNRYFVAGRHLKFAVIVISQTFTGVPPMLRTNCDISVAFYLDSQDNREAFAKQYLSTKNKNIGIMLFEKITTEKEYQCIVCMNCNISNDPECTVRKYIAKAKVPKFKVGKNDIKNLYVLDAFVEDLNNNKKVELNISKSNGRTIKLK